MKKQRCVACGSRNTGHFIGRTMTVRCKHIEKTVTGLSGIKCREPDCGESIFINGSGKRFADAGDSAVMEYRAEMTSRYREATEHLGLKRNEVDTPRLCTLLSSGNPVTLKHAAFLLQLIVNEPRTLGNILRHGG
jgi:hypothetical protein